MLLKFPNLPTLPKFSFFWTKLARCALLLDEIGSLRSPISLLLILQEKKVFVSFAFGNLH